MSNGNLTVCTTIVVSHDCLQSQLRLGRSANGRSISRGHMYIDCISEFGKYVLTPHTETNESATAFAV